MLNPKQILHRDWNDLPESLISSSELSDENLGCSPWVIVLAWVSLITVFAPLSAPVPMSAPLPFFKAKNIISAPSTSANQEQSLT